MSFQALLDQISQLATSEREKGEAFEYLVRDFLTHDAAWADRFTSVHMWNDWPRRAGRPDIGIDLVAENELDGERWAIQCKFYAPSHTLQKSDIDSFFTASGKEGFTHRLIVSTTDNWSKHAEEALNSQQVPVIRLRAQDLDESSIDWTKYTLGVSQTAVQREKKTPRPHQVTAIDAVLTGLQEADRGKLIMACGTGKTFTSLQIAEKMAGAGGRVLFLAPSISLLSQTVREWNNEARIPLHCYAVCSDSKVGKREVSEDISTHDLMYPATTNPAKLIDAIAKHSDPSRMTVIFSTYQSIQVVAEAQQGGMPEFDLIVCDEAHRTTGVTLADEDESNFVRVHDSAYLKANKRLYMTATPRIYDDSSKVAAQTNNAEIASMDDESKFGKEMHRLGFGEAVEKGLLSDYKVLVLAVDEGYVSRAFQQQLSDENHELRLEDAAKIVGCWNGLAKRRYLQSDSDGNPIEDPEAIEDAAPMRRAVAFARSIKDSKRVAELFSGIVEHYVSNSPDPDLLRCEVQHVDGTFNVLERNKRLDWLEAQPSGEGDICRILTNARCLSEGVDVPALDAVIFLNPRNSTVDVVQSVGRVMRKHPDKQFGYVILPIGIPADMRPEDALADNQKYKVVWQVLQALRAHDDRFNAMVNKIELNKAKPDTIEIIGVGGVVDEEGNPLPSAAVSVQGQFAFPRLDEWRDAIFAKMVQKVGDRRYWEDWAHDIAQIAERHVTRIGAVLDTSTSASQTFDTFLHGLQGNLNESVTRTDAIEMLAQHIITRPVFDALFEGYEFSARNPVSVAMQQMLRVLDASALDSESETLERFYSSVRLRASGIDNAEGKQRIITELYEKFFRSAFPRTSSRLGIVYTPIEVVDYLLKSVQDVLQSEFASSLSDDGVHILDPFTGTGTFIVRLLESGLLDPAVIQRKYSNELHANEIVLLAYYIAAINIESSYHGISGGDYVPFEGIVLTDTFQMFEQGDEDDYIVIPANNTRVVRQKKSPIRVIIGNPPYSVGQGSENDANKNVDYPTLNARIQDTYARRSNAGLKRNVYDSYIQAFRWASDRIGDTGVVAFVSNGSWIDAKSLDGFRKTICDEFTAIWVLNLRGNQRTSGEVSRKEGGKIFGQGSRTPVAITILVRNPAASGKCRIHYRDVGDYLTREEKLSVLRAEGSVAGGAWQDIHPNEHGDWLNLRSTAYEAYLPMGSKSDDTKTPIFGNYSLGVITGRDAWAVNSCVDSLAANMSRMIDNYNKHRDALGRFCRAREIQRDEHAVESFCATASNPLEISWTANLKSDLRKDRPAVFRQDAIVRMAYRPFFTQYLYFDSQMNERGYQMRKIFPPDGKPNLSIHVVGAGSPKEFSALMIDAIPDLSFWGSSTSQTFPRFLFGEDVDFGTLDFGATIADAGRQEAITEAALQYFRDRSGLDLDEESLFFYVYGLLHSPQYVERFGAEFRRGIPRIPCVEDFSAFEGAGRQLSQLHLNYESVEPWPLEGIPSDAADPAVFEVQRMRFARRGREADLTTIIANQSIVISGIPLEAYRYRLAGKSAVEWIIDRYQVTRDPKSGIVNDPNRPHDPRYIVDLLARIVRVSVESAQIVDGLPELRIRD